MKKFIFISLILTSSISYGRQCLDDNDCDRGQVCGKNQDEDVRGFCVQSRRPVEKNSCRSNYDCSSGFYCEYGQCKKQSTYIPW